MAVLDYVFDNADALQVDRSRILLYGDSAGGALAATVTIWNRDGKQPPLCGQLLCYPVCDAKNAALNKE